MIIQRCTNFSFELKITIGDERVNIATIGPFLQVAFHAAVAEIKRLLQNYENNIQQHKQRNHGHESPADAAVIHRVNDLLQNAESDLLKVCESKGCWALLVKPMGGQLTRPGKIERLEKDDLIGKSFQH